MKLGIPSPAPSRMLRKISPSEVPLFQTFGEVRSVALATTSTVAFPSLPWQGVQSLKTISPRAIDFLEYGTGLLSFLASSALSGMLSRSDFGLSWALATSCEDRKTNPTNGRANKLYSFSSIRLLQTPNYRPERTSCQIAGSLLSSLLEETRPGALGRVIGRPFRICQASPARMEELLPRTCLSKGRAGRTPEAGRPAPVYAVFNDIRWRNDHAIL